MSEEILRSSLAAAGADPLPGPLPRIPYDEALLRYGSDKPDLRFGLEIRPLPEGGRGCGFRVFEDLGPEPQLLYAFLEEATGRGYATEAARWLVARAEGLGRAEVLAAVDAPNAASVSM